MIRYDSSPSHSNRTQFIPDHSLDSPAQNGLVRAGDRAHVSTDGSLNQLRPVRGHHAAAGGVLHVRLVRDEAGGVHIRNGEEHRRAEANGNGTGTVPEFGVAVAR